MPFFQAEVAATMAELKLDLTAETGSYTEQEAEIMERLWTTQPYSKNQSLRRMDRVCAKLHLKHSVSHSVLM